MKKFIQWLKGPKSDFALFALFLILINIVGYNAFLRFDLTSQKAYSLSKESKELVKNVQEPLNVKVFFDEKLPAPYNNVKQYVTDILKEYEGSGNKNFTVSFMDMSKNENRQLASEMGLQQIQIQEVKNNEIGFKQGYMGLAITYGDALEFINPITSSNGFEYTLTSRMTKMINMADTLAGFSDDEKVTLTLYYSDILDKLGISGSRELKEIVEDAFNKVNEKNLGRLEFITQNPTTTFVDELTSKYGIQEINYTSDDGTSGKAAFGLVLSHDDKFYSLPLFIKNSLFGYVIAGLDSVEESINEGLESLLNNVKEVGYIVGHEELDNQDPNEAGNFGMIVSSLYEFVNLDLSTENIPAGMNTIVINGPEEDFTEEELYKIDQFIMKGGNVLFFVDSVVFDEVSAQSGGAPFVPNYSNLDRLLENYGVKRELNVVMDKNCYEDYNPQMGKIGLNWAPVLQKDQLAKKHPITNNLGYVVMLQNGALDITDAQNNPELTTTVLAKSSNEAWTVEDDIILHPMYIAEPSDKSVFHQENLAVLLEGNFTSAFETAVEIKEYDEDGNVIELQDGNMSTNNHLTKSIMPGKIFVTSSSQITTPQVIDEKGDTPIAMFLMNVVDYMNGNAELCEMRTKSLDVHTLTIKSMAAANFWKFFNQFGLAILFVFAGLIVWKKREVRRRAINEKYNPNDERVIDTKKEKTESKNTVDNSEANDDKLVELDTKADNENEKVTNDENELNQENEEDLTQTKETLAQEKVDEADTEETNEDEASPRKE